MSDDHNDDPIDASSKAANPTPPVVDERDATIERLQRKLADERQHSATLRNAAEELRFKAEVLETSYAKQLADTRQRSEAAGREVAEQQARIAALEQERDETMQMLSEARARLERLNVGGRLAGQPAAPRTDSRVEAIPKERSEADLLESSLTINHLLEDALWLQERKALDDAEKKVPTETEAGQGSPSEEMLPPDLMFQTKRGDGG